MLNRKFAVLVSSALMATMLFGCMKAPTTADSKTGTAAASTNTGNEKATLTVWTSATDPTRKLVYDGIFAGFMKENPNITLDYLAVPGDPNAFVQKLDMALAAGTGPDLGIFATPAYIQRGALEPLDSYFEKSKLKDMIPKDVIEKIRSIDQKDKKLYGIFGSGLVNTMWVRSDWLKEKNLTVPKTWDEFFAAAEKLTDKASGRYGYSIRGGSGSAQNLEYLMYAYSGITTYFDVNGKSTINDPLHVEFLKKYLGNYGKLTPEDDLTKGWVELAATFQSGKAGMIFHNLGSASSHTTAFKGDTTKFEVASFPSSVKGYPVHSAFRTDASWTISAASKYKAQAWKFVEYMAVNADAVLKLGAEAGGVPLVSSIATSEEVKKYPYIQFGLKLIGDTKLKYTDNPYWLPDYTPTWTSVAEPGIQKVMAGKMTAQELLDQWANALTKGLADYKAKNK